MSMPFLLRLPSPSVPARDFPIRCWRVVKPSLLSLMVTTMTAVSLGYPAVASTDVQPNDQSSSSLYISNYQPPSSQTPPSRGSTDPGIVRGTGCSAASTTGLVPLAPQAHIGQTHFSQPTIAWFSPETESYTVEFRVAERLPDDEFHVIYSTEFESTEKQLPSGIMTVSLAETDVTLSPDRTYRWQAVLVCNPNRPTESLVAEADIQVVETPAELDASLTTAADAAERSTVYATAGLWYDAMGEALNTPSIDFPIALLEDLVAIETEPADSTGEATPELSYSDRLQAVIDHLR